jgi:phosphoglucosamine mutase
MARQLFGTDGMRGIAGQYPLDDATVFSAGEALGRLVVRWNARPEVLIGMDTRESGARIAGLLAGGLERAGVSSRFAGVITTPGIAFLTRTGHFVAGVMISASHNPYQDNGIKVFSHSGFKLPDEQEEEVEKSIAELRGGAVVRKDAAPDTSLADAYISHLAACIEAPLNRKLKIVADCANGAAFRIAPRLFEKVGIAAEIIADHPDGRNINRDCGSLYLDTLRSAVLQARADLGVAFDGDADRALFVSATGREINGDAVLWMAARHLRLPMVVMTTMSNLGLEKALEREGVAVVRTPVGDKYVLEEMLRRGAELGGEQSGHIIFRRYATTGDGLLTALKVLEIASVAGKNLDELTAGLPVYPQTIRNVRVRMRVPFAEIPAVDRVIRSSEQGLAGRGRVVVRYSGTEPLARVMVEAETQEEVELHAARLVQAITDHLGA